MAVPVQLLLRWSTYLFFNSDTVNFVPPDEGEAESILLLIFVLWKSHLFESHLFPATRNFSRSSKHDTFWHVVSSVYFYISAFCFYEPLLFQIFVP